MVHDAIVIGAGLSGLVCARRLVEGGARVLVLEARTRVGGRLLNGSVAGTIVDLGGQWLTAGQRRLAALADELGIATYEHARHGRAVVDEMGGIVAKIAAAFAQRRAMKTIEAYMQSIPQGAPAAAPNAAALDRMTLAAWLDKTIANPLARERIRLHADLVFAADPGDISLLSYLSIMRATGGFEPDGPDLQGGGREQRFEGGAQRLATRLYELIADKADVRLGHPIQAIDDTGATVIARGPYGEHAARRLVLAVPPALVRELAVELAPGQRAFVDGVRVGGVVKCFAAYERPFWRERGLSGEAYLPHGTVRATVEIPGASALLAFVVGPAAVRWARRHPTERRAAVLSTLANHFGDDARWPIDFVEHDWVSDRASGGCVAATPPDVLARGARWREPHGRIHIAGTEAAIAWPGYMDGAIESGERAATEALELG